MPLRSKLFSSSAALQACLDSDAAHVVPGAKGDHVARIQMALVRLGLLDADDAQAGLGNYGPRTAAAVLKYKTIFGIVNFSYQPGADDIVGRMTIASLDRAIFELEGGGGAPPLPAFPGPHPVSPDPKLAAAAAGPAKAVTGPANVSRTEP